MKKRVYLDNNATTPIDDRVLEVLNECLRDNFGNPSSTHFYGQQARKSLVKARNDIASYLGVQSREVIFCSGGTEALNMTIRGIIGDSSGHIITSDVEHSAVHNNVTFLEEKGCDVTYLPAGEFGAVTPEAVKEAIREDTRLLVLMAANNVTGVVVDIEAIAKIAYEANIPFVVDAVALLGKAPINIYDGITAMCFSGHKIHAPKGVGMAFVRKGTALQPLIIGGGQEYDKRSGTENLPSIVALSEAVNILKENLPKSIEKMLFLCQRLEDGIRENITDIVIHGTGPRLVNTVNISFLGVEGESLLMHLDMAGIAVSHGSACSSGVVEPSRVLINMGATMENASSGIRFSLSKMNTEEEIDYVIDVITTTVKRLRNLVDLNK